MVNVFRLRRLNQSAEDFLKLLPHYKAAGCFPGFSSDQIDSLQCVPLFDSNVAGTLANKEGLRQPDHKVKAAEFPALIEKFLADNGADPVNKEPLSEEQLIEIKCSPLVKPKPPSAASPVANSRVQARAPGVKRTRLSRAKLPAFTALKQNIKIMFLEQFKTACKKLNPCFLSFFKFAKN